MKLWNLREGNLWLLQSISYDERNIMKQNQISSKFQMNRILFDIGGTQTLFRNLPKFSNIGKIFRSSCLASKIVPSHEIWAHGPVPEPRNRIRHFEVWGWEKYPWKLVFWKTLGAIVISVERSSTSPRAMEK